MTGLNPEAVSISARPPCSFRRNQTLPKIKSLLSLEKEKIRAEEDSDFYQHKYESLAKELRETKEKLEEAESIKLKYTALKTDFEEFSEKLQKKDEVIRNSNNRYTLIVKKIDALTTEKKI